MRGWERAFSLSTQQLKILIDDISDTELEAAKGSCAYIPYILTNLPRFPRYAILSSTGEYWPDDAPDKESIP